MMLNETYTLSNGVKIPKLGLGTWFIDDDKAEDAVKEAVKLGYRLIDTAQAYGNECGVGEGVRNCGLPRNEIFVTSKVAAEAKSYESPQPWAEFRIEKRYFKENKEVWRALEDAYTAGKIKAIGVSNFLQDDLENILADCKIKPMVNQILLHISNTNTELVDFCNKNGILVEAYSPIAHGEALKNDAITAMAKKYGVSTAQLCIRYVIQLGTVALPKTGNPVHMKDNANVDFEISDEDMKALKEMEHIDNYGEFNVFPVFSGKPLA